MAEKQPVKISDDVLKALGMESADLARLDEEARFREYRRKGESVYDYIAGKSAPSRQADISFHTGEVRVDLYGHNTDTAPASVMKEVKEGTPAYSDAADFLYGYGNRALKLGDWAAAIEALDFALKDGVMASEDTMRTLRSLAQDELTGVRIAQLLQKKLNSRASQSTEPQK